ncbi:translation factor GTPase family protein [Roseburia hominis]
MGITSNKPEKHICIGILAHVDAGKTTLSESILYLCGNIRKLGRVDHGNAFLDNYELERSRGITIFSKQAVFDLTAEISGGQAEGKAGADARNCEGGALSDVVRVTLLDTPGHVDFSAEMERTLQVLDYAVLVINGADGVQAHTRTLWSLLAKYRIPVFLFVNKMDQPQTDRDERLAELRQVFGDGCIAFDEKEKEEEFWENLSMCEEEALNEYLEEGQLADDTVRRLIAERKAFPCYFGSALKACGVMELLDGLRRYAKCWEKARLGAGSGKADRFGAKVYKISRDSQGNRLTHLKVTGGVLKVKDMLGNAADASEHWEEKVNQIRIYSGEKFEMAMEAGAGMVCAVTGLNYTYPGQGLGIEEDSRAPILEPVLNYRVILPDGCDAHTMLKNLRQLEEEEPMLRIVWNEELGEIHAQVMGEVQIEILQSLIKERFGLEVSFGAGNIVYKETIKNTVEGVGHFEPLRHYAEVHLLLEPGKPGSGLVFASECSEDELDRNWQRLILTHLMEKDHRGVLTGSVITDMKITLIAGRAHLKHTEGGDFRQSTYRAVRQGLMQAESVLLEPFYDFCMEIPAQSVGRALTDIQKMCGEFQSPKLRQDMAVIVGKAPVSTMRDYQMEVTAYTKGQGRIFCTFRGYEACHNEEEVLAASGYEPEHDLDNPAGSVFCAHGAGFNVPWEEVPSYMHLESRMEKVLAARRNGEGRKPNAPGENARQADSEGRTERSADMAGANAGKKKPMVPTSYNAREDKELEEIFIRTYGKVERKPVRTPKTVTVPAHRKSRKKEEEVTEYLLVDGYNVIFAWEDLKELARDNIEGARGKLMDILSNYQGFKKCVVILVFDAYKVQGDTLEIQKYHNIHVVYTKEAETADQYIEKVVHEIGRKYHVTVVTSDGVEQVVTLGQGGTLISSREFLEEVRIVNEQIREEAKMRREPGKNYLFDHMDEELASHMEEVRLGRKKLDDRV